MSDTPRTDVHCHEMDSEDFDVELAKTYSLARQLERELAEVTKERDTLGAWVDVNERRPEKMGYVLCACEGGKVDISFYDPTAKLGELGIGRKRAGKWGRYFDLAKMGYKITHWMPMPKHPCKNLCDQRKEALPQ